MPILRPNDQLIARLKLPLDSWATALPNPSEAAGTFTNISADAVKEAFARDQIANWATGFQALSGSVMQRVGAPQGDSLFGDDLFNGLIGYIKVEDPALQVLGDIGATSLDKFIDKAIEYIQEKIADLLIDVLGPLINMQGTIPIYGWIIEAAWDIAMGIVKLVKLVKASNAEDPELEYAAAKFSPDADSAVAAKMGRLIRTENDWTNIFRPPGVGEGDSPGVNITRSKIKGGGYRLLAAGYHEGWFGFVPGTTTLDLGFEIYSNNYSRGLGQLFPTTRNLGISVWDQINRKSPAMFAVNARACWGQWEGHLGELRDYLYTNPGKAAKEFVNGYGEQVFGWSSWDTGKPSWQLMKDGNIDSWDDYYKGLGISHLQNRSTPARAMKILYDRQMAYLNTTACAYVNPENYGAFGDSWQSETQKMLERVEENRLLLLQHPARCNIDLNNIPDYEYRNAMATAQKSCQPGNIGDLVMPPKGSGPKRKPIDAPEVNPVPGDASLKPMDSDGLKKFLRSGGKLTPLLLIGAAVGGLWYSKRKGYI